MSVLSLSVFGGGKLRPGMDIREQELRQLKRDFQNFQESSEAREAELQGE